MNHDKMLKFYAFYGITSRHPIFSQFSNSNISGSYFLGKCSVRRSAIYKSDIRGDELKRKGDSSLRSNKLPLVQDEITMIRHSLLYKTLVHNNSHNSGTPEEFLIRNTISTHYANIHGSTLEGCFLGPFATVDLMNLHSCIIGEFSYVQVGELFQTIVDPGTIKTVVMHRTIKLFHLIQFNHIEQVLIKESIHQSKLNHNNWELGFLK